MVVAAAGVMLLAGPPAPTYRTSIIELSARAGAAAA